MWKSFKNRTFTCFLPLKYGEIYCFLHNKKLFFQRNHTRFLTINNIFTL